MKRAGILILIVVLFSCEKSSSPFLKKAEIKGTWTRESGWFPDENLEFSQSKEKRASGTFYFGKKGSLEYVLPEPVECPVGMFTMKDGNWVKDGEYLTLEMRGLKIADHWYWWKIKYKILKLTEDRMHLEVVEIYKNKKNDPHLTWEDLIKE